MLAVAELAGNVVPRLSDEAQKRLIALPALLFWIVAVPGALLIAIHGYHVGVHVQSQNIE